MACDFFRLGRESVLEKRRRVVGSNGIRKISMKEAKVVDKKWWNDLVVASCWLPLCMHWSLDSGLRGINDGVIGLLGVIAGAESTRAAWAQTEAV